MFLYPEHYYCSTGSRKLLIDLWPTFIIIANEAERAFTRFICWESVFRRSFKIFWDPKAFLIQTLTSSHSIRAQYRLWSPKSGWRSANSFTESSFMIWCHWPQWWCSPWCWQPPSLFETNSALQLFSGLQGSEREEGVALHWWDGNRDGRCDRERHLQKMYLDSDKYY